MENFSSLPKIITSYEAHKNMRVNQDEHNNKILYENSLNNSEKHFEKNGRSFNTLKKTI